MFCDHNIWSQFILYDHNILVVDLDEVTYLHDKISFIMYETLNTKKGFHDLTLLIVLHNFI